ncbi:hypothetical protein [Streptomyces sp. NPDC045470]|uniref:hypothetical protein n=1 Tax=unclassified Streptomyces TaxID=2593676 RepID=UPI0033CE11C0
MGGTAYLHAIVQSVPTADNADHYAEIVPGRAVVLPCARSHRHSCTYGLDHFVDMGHDPCPQLAEHLPTSRRRAPPSVGARSG